MIGFFLIALVLFFIIAFIALLIKRKKEDLSEIASSGSEEDSITSDSLPLMASEVIIDNDIEALPEAVDLTQGLPPPEDQGDLGADTSIAVCSAMDYLADAIDPGYNQADNTPDPIDNSSSNNNESSNSYDYGSSSDYGSTSSGGD